MLRPDQGEQPDEPRLKGDDDKTKTEIQKEDFISVVQNTSRVKMKILDDIVTEINVNYEFQKNYPSNTKASNMRSSFPAELCNQVVMKTGKLKMRPRSQTIRRSKSQPETVL